MRSIERFSKQELTQIALQTVNLIELSTIYANFGDSSTESWASCLIPAPPVRSGHTTALNRTLATRCASVGKSVERWFGATYDSKTSFMTECSERHKRFEI
jgi:hypothetical protein